MRYQTTTKHNKGIFYLPRIYGVFNLMISTKYVAVCIYIIYICIYTYISFGYDKICIKNGDDFQANATTNLDGYPISRKLIRVCHYVGYGMVIQFLYITKRIKLHF